MSFRRRMNTLCLAGTVAAAAAAGPANAQTELATVAAGEIPGSRAVGGLTDVYLAFTSTSALVPADTNPAEDFYFYDFQNSAQGLVLLPYSVIQAGYPNNLTAGWRPSVLGVSNDGRYISFLLTEYSGSSQTGKMVVGRYDRELNVRTLVVEGLTPDTFISRVAVASDGQSYAYALLVPATGELRVFARAIGSAPVEVGLGCAPATCRNNVAIGPTIRGSNFTSGPFVSYVAAPNAATGGGVALALVDLQSGNRSYFPEVSSAPLQVFDTNIVVEDGIFNTVSRQLDRLRTLGPAGITVPPTVVSADVKYVIGQQPMLPFAQRLLSRSDGSLYPLPMNEQPLGLLAGARRYVALRYGGGSSAFVLYTFDADNDFMLDPWESRYGLDPTSAADTHADPDGDGVANGLEAIAGTHPTAAARRVFAEGAASSFFDTLVHVFNPASAPTKVAVRFLGPGGEGLTQFAELPAKGRLTLPTCCIAPLPASEFSIIVESDTPVVAEREMKWDRVTGYGSHATAGSPGAATEWYFAEGATIADFQLFYLFVNPGQAPATVDVEYLLAAGTSVTKQYVVAPSSRLTVWVNQEGAPLDAAEISARIVSSQPIVAERASYLSRGGQTFAAGSASTGITTPAQEWRFAEGATGEFFDTFLLVGNPTASVVDVQATYQLPSGTTVLKNYSVPAKSRLTIWVDQEDPQLASTPVSTVITATGNVVAERAMWWPGSGATWAESHTEVGATMTATKWGVADAAAGTQSSTSTFLLLSNPGSTAGRARITLYGNFGEVAGTAEYVLPATSRTTAWLVQDFPQLTNGVFSAVVESLPGGVDPAVPISVERASYSLDFAAGSAATATPIP